MFTASELSEATEALVVGVELCKPVFAGRTATFQSYFGVH